MTNGRRAAYDVLLQIYKKQAFSNLTLDQVLRSAQLPIRERAFASRLVYGTVERQLSLDYIIERYLTQPIQNMKLQVLVHLRMAVYQLYFMDKVPAHAVIDETVGLAKSTGCGFASGMMNAVLRKAALEQIDLEQAPLSVRYSCPAHLIRMWTKMYGQTHTMGILSHINEAAPLTIRTNTILTNAAALRISLEQAGVKVKSLPLADALELEQLPGVAASPQFLDGLFHVQDMASQLCAVALGALPGETVFDMCAAPGGKSFTLAEQMEGTGRLCAFDYYEHRLELIQSGAQRLGLANIETAVQDARCFAPGLGLADRVLCDVPCSGLGIIRRKPEVRYKELDSLKELPALQLQILSASSAYVKPGGTLLYSTCALNKRENQQVADAFLQANPEFTAVPCLPEISRGIDADGPYLTLFPHLHGTDGFFMAKLERSKA